MSEEKQPEQNKSTRSFEEWKRSLELLICSKYGKELHEVNVIDDRVKPYYDQGLQPYVAFNELFNK